MSKKRKTKKIKLRAYLGHLLFGIVGFISGIIMMEYAVSLSRAGKPWGEIVITFIMLFIWMYVAFFIHIIIHELGHLFFGLLTGYRFSSFRIGSFMLIKKNDSLSLKKLSIAGTGGQCLLIPPDMVNNKIPYVLYNLGGPIFNLIFATFILILLSLLTPTSFILTLLVMFTVIGFFISLMNGIPMRFDTMDNDGYNALSLGKNEESLRAFWIQMRANEQVIKGVRLRDMPEEWFRVPSKEGMKNSMIATIGVFACNRLMDLHEFEKATQLMEELLSMESGIVDLHRRMLIEDRVYCELIKENRKNKLDEMRDKSQMTFIKSMKNFPSVLRTRYAYELLYNKDITKAEEVRKQFDKRAETYPYPSDMDSERELMDYAKQTYDEISNIVHMSNTN